MNLSSLLRTGPRARRNTLILANGLLLTAGVLTLLSFATRSPRSRPADPVAPAPVDVPALLFETGTPSAPLVLPARVKAAEEVTLNARIGARLTALPAREGSRVRRGDPVAIFAEPESRRALAAARAEQSAAELSLAVAARQAARMESLYVSRVVAERDREVAADGRRSAEARLEAARAALDAIESAVTVRAPFDGVVVAVHVDRGADLAPGAPLIDLRSDAAREIVVELPEDAANRLAGRTLSAQIGDGPWRPARLARLEGMTDWRSRSRTAHLEIDGDAEPGSYARVALTAGPVAADAGTIPLESLVTRGALSGVFVIEHDRAHLRWLSLGRTNGRRVEVLAGLESGERYAGSPERLVDGRAVRVR